jgi:hypothetical protein
MRTALAIATLALVAAPPAEPVPLFTAMPFDGWKREGSPATFTISGTDATTTLDGLGKDLAANSFLTSPRPLGDFTLEVDVRIEPGTNSGIQVRSRIEDGRVRGPQVEIDPTPRAWSGGIYDEGDRGWMHPLEGREEARKAFIVGAWNRYRIECDGPRIRTWVNGVACSDWLDAKSVEGLLAGPCRVAESLPPRARPPRVDTRRRRDRRHLRDPRRRVGRSRRARALDVALARRCGRPRDPPPCRRYRVAARRRDGRPGPRHPVRGRSSRGPP